LLARYFNERGLLSDFQFEDLEEDDVTALFAAYERLPDDVRSKVDADFGEIEALATDAGIRALLEEARSWDDDLDPVFQQMEGSHDKAFWTFLERPDYIPVALQFVGLDGYKATSWTKRKDVPSALAALDDEAECGALAKELRACFSSEGRGYLCTVHRYEREAGAIWYFAYLDDYGKNEQEYQKGSLTRRAHRPALEVTFVHAQDDGTLDVCFDGSRDRARELMRAFARAVLGFELPDELKDERIYNLNRFKHRDISFTFDPLSSGIKTVSITLLKFTEISGRKFTVQPGKADGERGIYNAVEDQLRAAREPVPFADMNVVRVGLRAELIKKPGQRGRPSRTFYLGFPNSCSLKQDGPDAQLRKMLIDSNIEIPSEPSQAA